MKCFLGEFSFVFVSLHLEKKTNFGVKKLMMQ